MDPSQRDAWVGEIAVLKTALAGIDGSVFLEFDVPRIGSRIDAVLVAGPAVFVIEFKVGERRINTHDFNQAWDYALDLKNFHLASHAAPIVPVLVATESDDREPTLLDPADDLVFPPMTCNAETLGKALRLGLAQVTGATLDPTRVGSGAVSADTDDHRGRAGALRPSFCGQHRAPRRWRAKSRHHIRSRRRDHRPRS